VRMKRTSGRSDAMLQGTLARRTVTPAERDMSTGRAPDDAVLLRRLAHGEAEALESLYQRHAAALFGYLLAIGRERTMAEEVLQDTFLAAWHAADGFQGGASVRTWLFAIARRQARDRGRRRQPPMAEDEEYLAVVDPAPGPEQTALERAEMDDLVAGINALSPQHREVLALVFVHGLSYAEAAHVLDVPIGTVRSRLSVARRLLQLRRDEGKGADREQ
jgi:RNA polymerase sigma-70 factor, ECF subfamily